MANKSLFASLKSRFVRAPGGEERVFPLDFFAVDTLIDRTARFAAVVGQRAVWRLDLATGAVDPWVPWDNCELVDIGPRASVLLFKQWGVMYAVRDIVQPPLRLPDPRRWGRQVDVDRHDVAARSPVEDQPPVGAETWIAPSVRVLRRSGAISPRSPATNDTARPAVILPETRRTPERLPPSGGRPRPGTPTRHPAAGPAGDPRRPR